MARRYSFPEPGCSECEHFQRMGNILCETRYCGGFPKRRKPKRFSSSDPKYKAPKWCPRRLSPLVCRIYGFADARSEFMENTFREEFAAGKNPYICPQEWHYKLRLELPWEMKARNFFKQASHGGAYELLSEIDVQLGEVIEIDDGLKPYCFYYLDWSTVVPVALFDRTKVQKGD